ncbi:MAG: PIN domain nuclease [Verrucomicrobia bacterium]|nr:PIN domain nuclease [Verrucomicrobiota bacterium]MBU4248184.1 PIN domain nuclease [Verrucomicrobiota bacterium]MBU4290118.1 PIN domain nuclease [Verrucomicrobiota bacterium]MBU4429940.1 PIN domain nuclease [Verrucomicrobiota bacterium]MBU4497286.1 PIN domain nuclease [Verrucomicrobiota bacterium]
MTIVDTTVWIDFFRGKDTPATEMLQQMLNAGEDICICGIILTEVLQGIREDAEHKEVASRFETFLFLPMRHQTFVNAARLYRTLRRKGVTIRNAVDCMIAAVAIEHDIPLLHHDRDFGPMAEHCGLKVIKTGEKLTNKSGVLGKPRR